MLSKKGTVSSLDKRNDIRYVRGIGIGIGIGIENKNIGWRALFSLQIAYLTHQSLFNNGV